MAKAYLGKISALVTANTSDFNSKLNASANEVRSFAKSMQTSLTRAQSEATAALRGIYTESQKVSRALQAVATQRLSFKGFDSSAVGSIRQAVDQFKALQNAAVQVNEPLSRAARAVERLSAPVQLAIEPSIRSAQKSAEYLNAALNRGGIIGEKSFERIQRKALAAAEAADRLAEAAQMASVGPRGTELAFAAPRVRDSLAASADVRQRAAAAPASALEGGNVARDVQKLVAIDNLIQKRRAEIESGTILNIDTSKARASLESLLDVASRVRGRIDSAIKVSVDSEAAQADVIRLKAEIESIRENVTFTVTGRVQNFDQARQELGRLTGAVEQFDAAQRTVFGRDLQRLGELVSTGDVAELEQVRQLIGRIGDVIGERRQLNIDTAESSRRIQEIQSALSTIRENVTFTITGRVQNFDQARQELGRLTGAVQQFDISQREAFRVNLLRLGELVSTGDVAELEQVRQLIDQISEAVGERKQINIDTTEAQRASEQLAASIERIRANANFVITGRPQNLDQVQAELDRVIGTIGQLSAVQRGGLQVRVNAVIEAIGRNDIDGAIEALDQLRNDANAGIDIRVRTSEAENRIRAINDSWDFAVRGVPTAVGQVDSEFQALASRISALDIENRLNLDPLIADFRNSVVAGEPLIAQFQRLLTLQGALNDAEERRAGGSGPPLPPGFGGRSDAGLGAPLGDATRQLDQFRSGIVAAKNQLDAMPAAIRSHFIPAIQGAEQEFIRLAALGPRATAEEIENATRSMEVLTGAVRRATQAASIQSAGDFINDANVRQSIGELQGLQQVLIQIGAVAGGPAARAYETYRQRLQAAIQAGETGLPRVRRELAALQQEAARAAAATNRISFGAAMRRIRRGGDVARGGFDNLSLAVNQAAFAIDDFFSSTGGLEFKLRAVSNNITQLAFILGGTKGLFIGLAAVIGGQVAVAINKWANEGRTAEDRTKALNDALAKQKSLAEEVAQAFRSLGESLTQDVFSPAAKEANDFRAQLEALIKKQKELRDSRVADSDPNVQRERANQAALQRRLDSEENAGVRIALQRQLEDSRRRERDAARAASEGTATREDVRGALESSRANVGVASLPPAVDPISAAARVREANRIRRQAAEDAARLSAGNEAEQRAAVEAEIRRLTPIAAGGGVLGSDAANAAAKELERLNQVLARLDANGIERANNAFVISVLEGAKKVSDSLSAAQRIIQDTDFGTGPGVIEREITAVGLRLKALADQLESPIIDEATKATLRDQQLILERQAANLNRAAEAAGMFATALENAVNSLARAVEQDLLSAESRAGRDANRLEAQFGPNDPRVVEARDNEDRLRQSRQLAQRQRLEIEQRIEQERADFEALTAAGFGDPEDVDRARRIRRLDAQANSLVATEDQRRAARQEADRLRLEQQQAFENRPEIRRLRRQADQGDIEAQRELQRQESAARGRQYSMTPGQRAGEELAQQIADIRERFRQAVAAQPNDADKLRGEMDASINRVTKDAERQVAPMIAGFEDQRVNARLGGEGSMKRAAIQAADISTTEGAKELNRLLRGDDDAKNVNIAELKRQTAALEDLRNTVKDAARGVGVAK